MSTVIWNYIFAGCIITAGLLLSALFIVEFLTRQQERAARRNSGRGMVSQHPENRRRLTAEDVARLQQPVELRHRCHPSKSWPVRNTHGDIVAVVCPECADAYYERAPAWLLSGDARPPEQR